MYITTQVTQSNPGPDLPWGIARVLAIAACTAWIVCVELYTSIPSSSGTHKADCNAQIQKQQNQEEHTKKQGGQH